MKYQWKLFAILIIISLTITGCSANIEKESTYERCYQSTSAYIEKCDVIKKTSYINGTYYLSAYYYDFDEQTNSIINQITCYSFDENKNAKTIVVLEDNEIIDLCFTSEGNIAVLKQEEISLIDKNSGKYTVFPIDLPVDNRFLGMCSYEDGLAIILNGAILFYSNSGELVSFIESDLLQGCFIENVFFYEGGNAYVAIDRGSKVDYLSISLKSYVVEKLTDSEIIGLDYSSALLGIPYSVNCETCDVYHINFEEREVELYASGNNMLIPPTNDGFSGFGDVKIADEDHLISVRNIDMGCEVVFIEEDPELHLIDREILRIGCTDLINSPSIKQAVYYYNSSQSEYLAIIEEYDIDYSDLTNSLLEITRKINDGDVPDIYCGNFFNFDYWGRNGMLIDLKPYLSKDNEIWDSVISSWTNRYGSCYRVFPSFSLSGFFTTSEMISTNELLIDDIPVCYKEQNIFGGGITIENLAYYTIISEIHNNIIQKGNSEIAFDDILHILQYATTYGVESSDSVEYIGFRDLLYKDTVLVGEPPNGVDEFLFVDEQVENHITFVGYPSLSCAGRMIIPNSQVAISSDTSNLQACLDFMDILFSDEVQKQCLLNPNCGIPVVEYILEEYLLNEMEENDYSQDSFQTYLEYVDSGNMIIIDDNGLYDIVIQELNSLYSGVPIEQVAESLTSRINIYLAESY